MIKIKIAKNTNQALNSGDDKKDLNKPKNNSYFMRLQDRQILYSLVGFLGGILLLSQAFKNNIEAVIIGGLIIGGIGYYLAKN